MVLDFNTLYDIPRTIEKFFDEIWSPLEISQRRLAYPPMNIAEDDNNIYVVMELPGVDVKDIDLTVADKSLILKGERKVEDVEYIRQERPTGYFQRIINLNVDVIRDNIKAKMKDGVLEIVLPKAEEVKPKKIQIES